MHMGVREDGRKHHQTRIYNTRRVGLRDGRALCLIARPSAPK